jgi:chaperonin cofactor prefoldin
MTTLHEITDKHRDLIALADQDEDMAQAVADTMESIEGEFEDKALSLITVVNNMDADAEAIKNEISRLSARMKSIENKQNHMREYLRVNMEASGINKIQCPLFTITLAKGRDIVSIDDEDKIPADYLNIKTIMTPMKKEILSALKEGEDVPGASITKSKSSLRIK